MYLSTLQRSKMVKVLFLYSEKYPDGTISNGEVRLRGV